MAKKRTKGKSNVFVSVEYFERYGISRQALRYRVEKGEIIPVGDMKGMYLYYQCDADYLILSFQCFNFRKHLTEFIDVIHYEYKCTKENYQRLLPQVSPFLHELDLLITKYINIQYNDTYNYFFKSNIVLPTPTPKDSFDEQSLRFYNLYKIGISNRIRRFHKSGLSIDDFLKEDALNKFHKKGHVQILHEYEIRELHKQNKVNDVEEYLMSIKPGIEPKGNEYPDVESFGFKKEQYKEAVELFSKASKFYKKLKEGR